jgi:serine/threonine protein phosphatase PrpC
VSLSREQRWPYGLFAVAEDTGTPPTGRASERTVEVIAEQVAPVLAYSPIPGSSQRSALLKMAVMRASLDLRQQGIRTAVDLEAAVTGILVVSDIIHVINVGDCRAYVFRPSAGLLQVASDHLLMSRLVACGLLEPKAIDLHVPGSQISHRVGGSEAGSEVDTLGIRVHGDDVLLLCSSGLWQALRLSDIEAILRATADPRRAATTLAYEAANRAGQDDLRVIVVRPLGEEMPGFGIAAAPLGYPRASYTAEQPGH